MTKEELIKFEEEIAQLFDNGHIPYLTHLTGGNEDILINLFKKVKKGDYIFSTHRSHYHYLLAGGSPEHLKQKILNGEGMFCFDKNLNFLSTSVLAGGAGISAGIALGLKMSGSDNKVWCFIGDGAEEQGHFYEAVRYVDALDLPCTFIIEDNNRSVETPRDERCGDFEWKSKHVIKYKYESTRPHSGSGNNIWIKFKIYE